MKKRPIIICLVVAILGSVIFWLQSNYIITGWLNGEAFYQGRPTSYWRRHVATVGSVGIEFGSKRILFRVESSLRGWLDRVIGNRTYTYTLVGLALLQDHPLWMGDPEARDVLTQLKQGSIDMIREFAQEGLARIQQKELCPPTSN
jgi:hypothetical protein